MATERFLNLPAQKQKRIIDAAIDELSRTNLNELSINQIVKNAGIPRGSFYDYFEDKSDLISYIMQDYKTAMNENLIQLCHNCEGDLFRIYSGMLNAMVDFGLSEKNYRFCKNVFSCLSINGDPPFEIIRDNTMQSCRILHDSADTSELRCNSDGELDDLIEILTILLRSTIVKIFLNIEHKDMYIDSYNNMLQIVKQGAIKQ